MYLKVGGGGGMIEMDNIHPWDHGIGIVGLRDSVEKEREKDKEKKEKETDRTSHSGLTSVQVLM